MEEAFQVAIPLIGKIQIDVGTVLSALVFLGFLIVGFDYISAMFFGSMQRNRYRNAADYYEEQARTIRESRDTNLEGSFEWEQQNSLYKKMLNKSNDFRVKGWR